jgi:hypothetical protein
MALYGGAPARVKGRASLAAARLTLKHGRDARRKERFLIHRSCGQLCGCTRAEARVFAATLHICYLGQKMSRHFWPVSSMTYGHLVQQLGRFAA